MWSGVSGTGGKAQESSTHPTLRSGPPACPRSLAAARRSGLFDAHRLHPHLRVGLAVGTARARLVGGEDLLQHVEPLRDLAEGHVRTLAVEVGGLGVDGEEELAA